MTPQEITIKNARTNVRTLRSMAKRQYELGNLTEAQYDSALADITLLSNNVSAYQYGR